MHPLILFSLKFYGIGTEILQNDSSYDTSAQKDHFKNVESKGAKVEVYKKKHQNSFLHLISYRKLKIFRLITLNQNSQNH